MQDDSHVKRFDAAMTERMGKALQEPELRDFFAGLRVRALHDLPENPTREQAQLAVLKIIDEVNERVMTPARRPISRR